MEAQKTAMMLIGVPESAIEIMSATRDNTAGESSELRRLLQSRGWSRIIVVTSKFHTARAGFAFRRSFNGTGIQVIVQATRYDTTDIDRWWEPRRNLRMGLFEAQSLLAYGWDYPTEEWRKVAKRPWRKRLGVEPSLPPKRQQPILKTGRATGPRSLPLCDPPSDARAVQPERVSGAVPEHARCP